jgi:hypothetical protein
MDNILGTESSGLTGTSIVWIKKPACAGFFYKAAALCANKNAPRFCGRH